MPVLGMKIRNAKPPGPDIGIRGGFGILLHRHLQCVQVRGDHGGTGQVADVDDVFPGAAGPGRLHRALSQQGGTAGSQVRERTGTRRTRNEPSWAVERVWTVRSLSAALVILPLAGVALAVPPGAAPDLVGASQRRLCPRSGDRGRVGARQATAAPQPDPPAGSSVRLEGRIRCQNSQGQGRPAPACGEQPNRECIQDQADGPDRRRGRHDNQEGNLYRGGPGRWGSS